MADKNAETRKRIKQLENQNQKLRKLLDTALEVSTQDSSGISELKDEARMLTETVNDLEKQKKQLEHRLSTILGGNEGDMETIIHDLEREHMELKMKLDEVLNEIKKDNEVIDNLKSEDAKLKRALVELENEKLKLEEKLKTVETSKSSLAQISNKLQEKLSELENRKISLTETKLPVKEDLSSEETILSSFKYIEKTYRDYISALEDHGSVEKKISQPEERKEELINIVSEPTSNTVTSQSVLQEVINSNTNLLLKIKNVHSNLDTGLSLPNSSEGQNECSEIVDRVYKLEQQKDFLYDELETSLEQSTREINKLSDELSDPEIRRLIHEIEVQKSVLLYNLKMLKMKKDSNIDLPNVPDERNNLTFPIPTTSELEVRANQLSKEDSTDALEQSSFEPSTSRNDHQTLEEAVVRLENERSALLRQLHSVSEISAQRFEERQLQTQSELHSTFMREKSSEDMVHRKNYDDATNQLYASEDARLEQRIRELEIENERIKKELDGIVDQIRDEQNGGTQLPVSDVLRERIEELEKTVPR